MACPSSLRIWVGTRKGAFAFTSKDRKKWDCDGPFFAGQEVHHVAQDPRDPKRHYAAVGNAWFGPHLHASTDNGKTWQISEKGLEVKGINRQILASHRKRNGAEGDPRCHLETHLAHRTRCG
ncbi:MAG TPA: hypothetical protein VIX91_13770 [Candidatus Acidoferrum sp.]